MSGFLKYFLPSVVVSDVVVLAKEGAQAPVGGQESLRAVAMVPFAHLGRTGNYQPKHPPSPASSIASALTAPSSLDEIDSSSIHPDFLS